jgi:PBP1b-binding outer membrane lipoprotein LpoB
MQNMKNFMLLIIMALLVAGCQVTIPPANNQNLNNSDTNATSLTILDAKALRGSEKVSVHAYSYTRGSDFCSRTIALKFSSSLPYTQTLIAMRNRALITGANALSITGWEEKNGITTFTGHFFDCHSKKGL